MKPVCILTRRNLGIDCVENWMLGSGLVRQVKAHRSPFVVSFLDEVASDPVSPVTCPGIRADCDKF